MKIKLAHSPDSDDAFMFYALASGRVSSAPYQIEHILSDIQTLNDAALTGRYDISAISLFAYPFVADKYQLLRCGASVGDNYGPMVVATRALTLSDFQGEFSDKTHTRVIGVPGLKTTAFLVLKLLLPEFNYRVMEFDQIIPACERGEIDAGLIIHEGQLNYQNSGLKKIVDLGKWWRDETNLPLPLGANIIRRDLGKEHIKDLEVLLRRSIEYSLADEHRHEAIDYCLQFARGLDRSQAERFVRMYVNERTLDLDADCLAAIRLLYERGAKAGLIPKDKIPQIG